MNTVFAIGLLVVGTIIVFTIVSTLLDSDLMESSRYVTHQYNDSVLSVVNETGSIFGNSTLPGAECTVEFAYNQTGSVSLDANNYTVDSTACTIACNDCSYGSNNTLWRVNSTTIYWSLEEEATQDMSGNFSSGVDNISKKIPTILTILAVVFLHEPFPLYEWAGVAGLIVSIGVISG